MKKSSKSKKPLIEISGLVKNFINGEVVTRVLKGMSFTIEEGEFVAIMGPSGSGKSTLMHILGFLDKATEGTYLFQGENVTEFNEDELARLRNEQVGFVFQNFNLLARTSVLDNVVLPLLYTKKKNKYKIAQDIIEDVGLGHRRDNLSNQLSGGEKQRVAIARALANDPKLIFADEPTGNLDSKTGQQIMKLIEDLNKQGRTIILVTHERDTAEHAQRIIYLRDGKIESDTKVRKRRSAYDGALKK